MGIAHAAAASLIDDCDHRLREHLRALPAPAENTQTLAEILSEDLAEWPANAWLVLDDYHEITPEPKAEDFIEALVSLSPVQFLIASRVRPRWVATKNVLYGDVQELTKSDLAMSTAEAADVLTENSAATAPGLVALANGWPAVIGLASVSSAVINPDGDQVPESLYRFFADEVLGALEPQVQRDLAILAIAPVLDREIAAVLLDVNAAESACSSALDVGLFVERGAGLEIHPLARMVLDERRRQVGIALADRSTEVCLDLYRARKDWDASFELILRTHLTGALDGLLRSALDDLLATARLSTIERWCDGKPSPRADGSVFSLARSEVMLRTGRHLEAVAYAEGAASDESIAFRALSVAGRAAHLASREEMALEFFRRAEGKATTDAELRDAKWGQLTCAIDLELSGAPAALDELSLGVSLGDVREVVRMATHRVYLQLRTGELELDEGDTALQLLDATDDPIVEASFLSGYAIALALAARYDDAATAAERLLANAERYRLDFAAPYALCALAMARAGRRQWGTAEKAAAYALEHATTRRDVHADLLSRSVLIRLYTQQGRLSSALDVAVTDARGALSASVAEAVCSRALALACAGRISDARDLIEDVRGTTRAIEPAVLIPAVEAVGALRGAASDGIDRAVALGQAAFRSGALDILVTSYRACPELLSVLLRGSDSRAFRELIERVGDGDLANAAGFQIAINDDRRQLLSPREREVFELLRNGLSTREIAKLLYIEPSTVKVHTQHIYDKLGVRSRSALTVQAALERSAQATSAIDSTVSDVGGSS